MPPSNTCFIFTDAATSPQTAIAIGAFICLSQSEVHELSLDHEQKLFTQLVARITYKKFQSNKSTWSEIQTFIEALKSLAANLTITHLEIYTDCQSLCDLLGKRKEKLIKNNFMTRSGKEHQHAKLYQELFALTANFKIEIVKIKGHAPKSQRLTWQQKIFAVLDKMSRQQLRLEI